MGRTVAASSRKVPYCGGNITVSEPTEKPVRVTGCFELGNQRSSDVEMVEVGLEVARLVGPKFAGVSSEREQGAKPAEVSESNGEEEDFDESTWKEFEVAVGDLLEELEE